jgi:predicted DNA-binding transcriptional regulator AlpA
MTDATHAPPRSTEVGEGPAGRPLPHDRDALLFTAEAAFLLGLSPRTLETLRLRGDGPPFIAVSSRAIRYRRSDLEAWISNRRRRSTSEASA